MTTINDISDLVRIIQEQPQWAETLRAVILGRELLELPEKFAEFVRLTNANFEAFHRRLETDVAELKTDMAEVKADVAELKTDMAEVKADVAELKTDVAEVKADVAELKTDVAELKTDMAEVKADVAEVKADVAELKTDMAEVKADVAELKTDVAELKGSVRQTNGRLDNLFGLTYEYKVEKNIRTIASQRLGIQNARARKGPFMGFQSELADSFDQAQEEGAITSDQNLELDSLDLIIAGWDRERNERVVIAAEVSVTLGNDDIERAARRAAILASATGMRGMAAVIGSHIDAERTRLAENREVRVALVPE